MMPFGSECCKVSNYMWICYWSRTQGVPHNGILKNFTLANIAIKAFLTV